MVAMKSLIVKGDIDGFFGLFIDNLLQLLLIVTLGTVVCGLPATLMAGTVLPAAGVSILLGNAFYAWQARRLARKEGRDDVTALPYGINTVSLIAYIFLVMGPVYRQTNDADLAWKAGLFACLFSGIIECVGAFVGGTIRKYTPRAALLSALAGIAVTFISMGFVFQIFASPLVGLIPMLLIFLFYTTRIKLPLSLPGGMVAILVGVTLAWAFRWLGYYEFTPIPESAPVALYLPTPVIGELLAFIASPLGWSFFGVILPMGLFNVIGSLQCLESAEAAGDRFDTRSSLLVNGAGTILAASLGSPFPTTIYIGHPGWKAMGARQAYSVINGVVIALLCFFGCVISILHVVPLETTLGILLWIGLVILAQSFQETPREHALAVGLGLVPSLAAWALVLVDTSLRVAGSSLLAAAPSFGNQLYIHGVIALSQGFLLSSMILASVLVALIRHKFTVAAVWLLIASACSFVGLIHAYTLTDKGVENVFSLPAAPRFAAAYLLAAFLVAGFGWWNRRITENKDERDVASPVSSG
jgi:AGZA family xanthine/uracil permease-like MFS transporter